MRWVLFLLLFAKFVWAGELVVIYPAESFEGDGTVFVYPFADVEFHGESEVELIQDGQVLRETYKNVPAGKYRVRFGSLGPIGWVDSYMETHVTIAKGEAKTVYLFKPDSGRPTFPKEILDGLHKAKKGNPRSWVELEVRYEGATEPFLQYRDLGGQAHPERFIRYLRTDGAYTLRVQGFDEGKVIYEVKFRVEDPEQPLDPFAAKKPRKFIIEKSAPAKNPSGK